MDNKYEVKITNKLNTGDKVKIDISKFEWKKDSYTPEFLQWINDNKENIFTLVAHNKDKIMWELKEYPRWLIYNDDLIKVN